MTNKEILSSLLTPVKPEGNELWENFLEIVDENLLWFPSSRSNFNDLNFRFSGISETIKYPTVYIHTCAIPSIDMYLLIRKAKPVIKDTFRIDLEDITELQGIGWNYRTDINYKILGYHEATMIASALEDRQVLKLLRSAEPKTDIENLVGIASLLRGLSYEDCVKKGKQVPFVLVGKTYLLKVRLCPSFFCQ